jgi:hypothetical protein
LEFTKCSYVNGRNLDHLLSWAQQWSEWSDADPSNGHVRIVMTPISTDLNPGVDPDHDVAWVDAYASAAAMHAAQALWNSDGGRLENRLREIVDCDTPASYRSQDDTVLTTLLEPDGVTLLGGRCVLEDGVTLSDALPINDQILGYYAANGLEVSASYLTRANDDPGEVKEFSVYERWPDRQSFDAWIDLILGNGGPRVEAIHAATFACSGSGGFYQRNFLRRR